MRKPGLGPDIEVLAELGRGADSEVYQIRRGGTDYALKMLRGLSRDNETAAISFRREAALLARVNHPGVPRVFDVGSADGRPYLVMEFVDGQPLAQRLTTGPLAEPELTRLAGDVAEALAAAHRAGVVHRDIKPANIIITGSGRARLIDFGLAATRFGGTPDEAVIGTFDYSAPEQTGMLARPVDGRADLYALGVVLYQCATGELPFQAEDVGQLLALHATAPAPDPRVRRPDLSPALAALIGRLLAKDPDDRPRSAQQLSATLNGQPAEPDLTSPLVGRDQERAVLHDRWKRALSGDGGAVLLYGSAGSGKSSLAAHLADTARDQGALVLSGKCDGDSPLPLAPLRTAVDGYLRTVTGLASAYRTAAIEVLREAAGVGAGLLRPLSPALALLLDAPTLAADERHEQFASAVAAFLAALATRHGGLVLVLDDVQWLDATSLTVLRRLAEDFANAPLLVLATARDDDPQEVARFAGALGDRLDLRVPVRRLTDESVADLVAGYLAGSAVGDDVMAELAARGRGNPFTTLQYLHALVDGGALRPSWGTWQLDAGRLQSIELPTDVFELVLARIGGLGEQVVEILTLAAAIGSRFDPTLLAETHGREPEQALAEGCQHGVLTAGPDGYAFVHDRIRESLLSAVDPPGRRRLHQRIAELLDARAGTDPAAVYALAGHYAQGERERTPDRVVATGWAAGQLALAEFAPSAAIAFLEVAGTVAEAGGTVLDTSFDEALASAYLATGQAEAAYERLAPALDRETDPMRRAALLLCLATASRFRWELERSLEYVYRGLAELGRPMPRHPVAFGLLTARLIGQWLLTGTRRVRRHPLTGEAAERLRLELELCHAGTGAAAMGLQPHLSPAFTLRPAMVAHRLGAGPEYALAYNGTSLLAGFMRLHGRRDRIFRRSAALAAELHDPKLSATLAWMHKFARAAGGASSWAEMAELIEAQRQWLELDYYTNMALVRSHDLLSRGYAREALEWHDRGRARLSSSTAEAFTGYDMADAMARSLLGQMPEAPVIPPDLDARGADLGYWVHHLNAAVQVAVEQDELSTAIDETMATFDRLGIAVAPLFSTQRMIFVYEALGRLTLVRRAGGERRTELLAAATAAVHRLGKAANDPLLRAYHLIATTDLEEIDGRADRALARLARAERYLVTLDAPLVHHEAARVRARALRAAGREELALQQADFALLLADRHGWARRARWIRAEWGNRVVAAGPGSRSESYRQHPSADADRYRRRLAALQQVNAAAANVLDPQRLARLALDETLRIFAAERAVLFLTGEDGRLRLSVGRTADGDLTELTGYSASLVDRVSAERRPIVVTGGEEGAALGSASAVTHGLRSIMIAPLEVDGRLLGVVYLDSRVAKGVFTDQDVDVLTAVTSQVAVSLETARAAQLEVAVHAARQQRDTAETLRGAMIDFTATRDPDQVLTLLRAIVSRSVAADRVFVIQRDGTTFTVAGDEESARVSAPDTSSVTVPGGSSGAVPDASSVAVPGAAWDAASAADLYAALFSAPGPRSGTAVDAPAAVAALLGDVRGWLTAPLNTMDGVGGVLVAGATEFGAAELDIAAALTGQAATAYDNARLFAQVQQLATTDALTGVYNRRHFNDLAGNQLTTARRNHRALAGMMVDIDHFKDINDAYGHATGDEVIRAVAGALRSVVREPDVLCRYGGEEFALVMSEMEGNPLEIAERMRRTIADLIVPTPTGEVSVTVSIGVAELKPDDDLAALLGRADEALYRAKQDGRNLVRPG
ncbi:hypothetical protein Ari01nite_26450 [Paractinoplanes rishiriensis]|uniref:Non-specific serine/threonine protein kinase n=1 Tax=Paractinoplanes rishiriensis TaxID=1050105 RepID=A0A919MWZ6_9ACTN|nr:hypothetical protein Ari01nite_26450 [Actinoplanes rishiriensis]